MIQLFKLRTKRGQIESAKHFCYYLSKVLRTLFSTKPPPVPTRQALRKGCQGLISRPSLHLVVRRLLGAAFAALQDPLVLLVVLHLGHLDVKLVLVMASLGGRGWSIRFEHLGRKHHEIFEFEGPFQQAFRKLGIVGKGASDQDEAVLVHHLEDPILP